MGTIGAGALVGREPEIDHVRRALRTAADGHGVVIVVEGEAGIGKSRVAHEALALALDDGFVVAEGLCEEGQTAHPFLPLAQALRVHVDANDADRRVIADLLASSAAATSELALSVLATQHRLVDLFGTLIEKIAEASPLLLVLEDLHWSDSSTLSALRSIVRRIRLLRVCIVVTMRPGYSRAELDQTVELLLREGATRLSLSPLAADDVASLAADLLGATPSPQLLADLAGATGNPLFVTEYVRAVAEGHAGDGVPVEFRHAVLRRTGQLSSGTNDVLRIASVLGATFAASELALALRTTPVELASVLQQAIDAGVIGDRGDRLAFRHDLVREAIYQHVPLDLRRALHQEVGNALAESGADPLAVAHHLALAASSFDEEAAQWLRRAAADVRLRAPAVAVALLERAVDLLPPQFSRRDDFLADMVMPLAWSGRLVDAEVLAVEVLGRNPSAEVAGALRCGLVYALTWQGRSAEALAYTEPVDGEVLRDEDSVLLDAEAAVAHLFSFNFPVAASKALAAEAAARALGHDLALCHALSAKAWVLQFRGQFRDAIEICREAIQIADESNNGQGHLAHPRFFPGISLINEDRLDEAQAVLERGRQISEELGLVSGLPMYHSHLGARNFVSGDWDAAVAELETCLRLAEETGTNLLVTAAGASWLSVIYLRRDDLDAAESTLRRQLERLDQAMTGLGLLSWSRAMLAEARGDIDEALRLLEPGFQAFFRAGATSSDPWTALALTRLLVRVGDTARAEEVVSVLEHAKEGVAVASGIALSLRCRGLVDRNAKILRDALHHYRVSGRRVDVADTLVDLGLQLLDDGRVEDSETPLDEAMEIFEDLGARRDMARVRAELRNRGVHRGARGKRARPTSGWESLTDTERTVASLVAQRMSNPEVAERLFVSRHTVESHLKNIFRKLGIGSRMAIAAHVPR